jgi:hypothetical protein
MDYAQIQAAKVAGTVIVTLAKEESITITTKKFDQFTGLEVAPEIQIHRKADLLREIKSIDDQIANLNVRKDAINSLLTEFEVPEPVESITPEPIVKEL